jgi:hypothetical protein
MLVSANSWDNVFPAISQPGPVAQLATEYAVLSALTPNSQSTFALTAGYGHALAALPAPSSLSSIGRRKWVTLAGSLGVVFKIPTSATPGTLRLHSP